MKAQVVAMPGEPIPEAADRYRHADAPNSPMGCLTAADVASRLRGTAARGTCLTGWVAALAISSDPVRGQVSGPPQENAREAPAIADGQCESRHHPEVSKNIPRGVVGCRVLYWSGSVALALAVDALAVDAPERKGVGRLPRALRRTGSAWQHHVEEGFVTHRLRRRRPVDWH